MHICKAWAQKPALTPDNHHPYLKGLSSVMGGSYGLTTRGHKEDRMAWEAEVSANTTDTAWVLGPGGQRGRGAQAGPHLPRIGVMWEGNQDRWAPWQDPQSMPVLKAPGCRPLTACSEPTRSRTCSRFQGPLPHHRGSPLPSDFLPSPGPYLFAPRSSHAGAATS